MNGDGQMDSVPIVNDWGLLLYVAVDEISTQRDGRLDIVQT